MISIGAALAGAALGLFVGGPVPAVFGFVCLAAAPLFYVHHRQKGCHNRLLAQLPAAFDLMARVLRSGHFLRDAAHQSTLCRRAARPHRLDGRHDRVDDRGCAVDS
jgi:Flp pilus assembly protein TadB